MLMCVLAAFFQADTLMVLRTSDGNEFHATPPRYEKADLPVEDGVRHFDVYACRARCCLS